MQFIVIFLFVFVIWIIYVQNSNYQKLIKEIRQTRFVCSGSSDAEKDKKYAPDSSYPDGLAIKNNMVNALTGLLNKIS